MTEIEIVLASDLVIFQDYETLIKTSGIKP